MRRFLSTHFACQCVHKRTEISKMVDDSWLACTLIDDDFRCWINEGNYMNVLVYPVCVSTLLNVLFLFNIVRVLLMKLRAGPSIGTQPSRSMRQAFRATLLLVPLLGLHYLVIPFRPPKNHPWEHFYEVLSAITASFQGLCVAILFCFCNGEVSKRLFLITWNKENVH